jgi:hypothetical protein
MKIKLSKVRQSFFDLYEPVQYQGAGAFRYNAAFLIEKGSANDTAIKNAINHEAAATFGKRADALLKSWQSNSNKYCYIDGDLTKYDFCHGFMVLGAHRRQADGPPLLLDADKTPLDPKRGRLYKGCNVNATVDVYGQKGQNEGMRCGLIGVQFHSDNEMFSGAARPSMDDFDALNEDADSLV